MTAFDALADEFTTAVCSLTLARVAEMQAAGIPPKVISRLICGMSPIETYRSGLFEIRDEGPPAVLLPCGIHDGLNWQLADLVAFYLDQPDRWWRRRGDAGVLGDLLHYSVKPRRLHLRPLDWLRDGGRGFSILDWAVDPVALLAGAGELVADRFLLKRLRKTAINSAVAQLDRMVSHG